MKAIILSAGEGSRMRPLTLTKPKTMLPVAGKPIIQYNIESLRNNGITDILLIVRYKEEMVRDYFGDGSDFGVLIKPKRISLELQMQFPMGKILLRIV